LSESCSDVSLTPTIARATSPKTAIAAASSSGLDSGDGNLTGGKEQPIRCVLAAEYRENRLNERTAALKRHRPVLIDGVAKQAQVTEGSIFPIAAQLPPNPPSKTAEIIGRGQGNLLAVAAQSGVSGQPAVSFPRSPRWHDSYPQ
jgi:hypothetical protein